MPEMNTDSQARRPWRFAHPEPLKGDFPQVLPLFLPQAGCPRKCVFCDQKSQTGNKSQSLDDLVLLLDTMLEQRSQAAAPPVELAFYGGTFTGLPESWRQRLLRVAKSFMEHGTVCAMRCSTRPDAVTAEILQELRAAGLRTVELGIQTFASHALQRCNRGYGPETARKACHMVHDAGLKLGIQLLPGAPGQHSGDFFRDISITCDLAPEIVRLYPCLVFAETPLAQLWRQGKYRPWSVERSAHCLGQALLKLWSTNIRVARMGVAHHRDLETHVLAGPVHPALGAMARSSALFRIVRREIENFCKERKTTVRGLEVPQRYQGEFFGHKGRWVAPYARLGLAKTSVCFVEEPYFSLF